MRALCFAAMMCLATIGCARGVRESNAARRLRVGPSKDIGRRLALVIGNQNYAEDPLKNARKDAKDISSKLRSLGFDVVDETDLSKPQFEKVVNKFVESLGPGDTSFVFYAGHGMQLAGENYLIPVDFSKVSDEVEARYKAYPLTLLLDKLEGKHPQSSIVVLDACRNNPFSRTYQRNVPEGLAPVSAHGTLIVYSAQPGRTAGDGTAGSNSPFTDVLLRFIDKEDVDIEAIFKDISTELDRKTNGAQVPYRMSNLTGTLILRASPPSPQNRASTPVVENAQHSTKSRTWTPALYAQVGTGFALRELGFIAGRYHMGPLVDVQSGLRVNAGPLYWQFGGVWVREWLFVTGGATTVDLVGGALTAIGYFHRRFSIDLGASAAAAHLTADRIEDLGLHLADPSFERSVSDWGYAVYGTMHVGLGRLGGMTSKAPVDLLLTVDGGFLSCGLGIYPPPNQPVSVGGTFFHAGLVVRFQIGPRREE